MENEIFFCKSSLSHIFVRTPKNPADSNIIYQNKEGKYFCIVHRTWETGKITKFDVETNEVSAEFDCGIKTEGFFADSPVFSYRIRVNDNEACTLLIEENYIDTETLEKCEAKKLSSKNSCQSYA